MGRREGRGGEELSRPDTGGGFNSIDGETWGRDATAPKRQYVARVTRVIHVGQGKENNRSKACAAGLALGRPQCFTQTDPRGVPPLHGRGNRYSSVRTITVSGGGSESGSGHRPGVCMISILHPGPGCRTRGLRCVSECRVGWWLLTRLVLIGPITKESVSGGV